LNLGIELPLFLDLLLLLLLLKLMLERHLCVKFPFKPIMFGISSVRAWSVGWEARKGVWWDGVDRNEVYEHGWLRAAGTRVWTDGSWGESGGWGPDLVLVCYRCLIVCRRYLINARPRPTMKARDDSPLQNVLLALRGCKSKAKATVLQLFVFIRRRAHCGVPPPTILSAICFVRREARRNREGRPDVSLHPANVHSVRLYAPGIVVVAKARYHVARRVAQWCPGATASPWIVRRTLPGRSGIALVL
jgi:hypothetical protein